MLAKRAVALLIIIVGALLIAVPAAWWLLTQWETESAKLNLPSQVAGLPLVEQRHGSEAIVEINRLHGLDFPLDGGAVGVYGEGGGAVLWVSETADQALASQLVEDMRAKIAEGRSPFRPLGERFAGERRVYELVGLGQRHFYFQAGELVVWLAAEESLAEAALGEALAFYR